MQAPAPHSEAVSREIHQAAAESAKAAIADLFDGNLQPLRGENFRSFLSRYIKRNVPTVARNKVRNALLDHFRSAGMDVDAPAYTCIAAINLQRARIE